MKRIGASGVNICKCRGLTQPYLRMIGIGSKFGIYSPLMPNMPVRDFLDASLGQTDFDELTGALVTQPIGIGIAIAIRDLLARAANGR